PCLCEKPLVAAADAAAGLQRIAAFRRRGLLLAENCQWPLVLPALFELHPELRRTPVRSVAMGLGPAAAGRAMVEDSLSHLLSVVQALVPLHPGALPAAVRQGDGGALATRNDVHFTLSGPDGPIAVELQLQQCPQQPRPAWLAVNGRRIDRRLGPDYSHAFVAADGRAVHVRDPLHQLVDGVIAAVRAGSGAANVARADGIALRLRLYAAILEALAAAGR
ncbi:MAG: hypothetical protein WBO45_15265, partial [Planctomycetota bacterium]